MAATRRVRGKPKFIVRDRGQGRSWNPARTPEDQALVQTPRWRRARKSPSEQHRRRNRRPDCLAATRSPSTAGGEAYGHLDARDPVHGERK